MQKNNKSKVTKTQMETWTEDVLMQSYPYYPWVAEVNTFTGQLQVWNLACSSEYGFSVNLHKGRTFSELKKTVLNFGGELLERANLPRSATMEFMEEFLATAERELNNSMTLVGLDKSK